MMIDNKIYAITGWMDMNKISGWFCNWRGCGRISSELFEVSSFDQRIIRVFANFHWEKLLKSREKIFYMLQNLMKYWSVGEIDFCLSRFGHVCNLNWRSYVENNNWIKYMICLIGY